MKLSRLANRIHISPIPVFAAEIDKRKRQGERLVNLTVGDFNPAIHPIPEALRDEIIKAYHEGHTNYPGAVGVEQLRNEVARLFDKRAGIPCNPENILIAGGSRPLILSTFMALVDPGEKVLFPVPSWNNDYYSHLANAEPVPLQTRAANGFMPTPEDIRPHIEDATLLCLCSPLNPAGTIMSAEQTRDICQLVIAENERRGDNKKPLHIMMDQVYWLLTFGNQRADNAIAVCPEIRDHIIFIDGISKAFASTGLRVGWAYGPVPLIKKMRALVAHMGAWAPKAEQVATGRFLAMDESVNSYLEDFRERLHQALTRLYDGVQSLKKNGHPIDAIAPLSSIYLSVRLDLIGATTANGTLLENADMVHKFILEEAKMAILPFSYFGSNHHENWYRLSVGACDIEEIDFALEQLSRALGGLQYPDDRSQF